MSASESPTQADARRRLARKRRERLEAIPIPNQLVSNKGTKCLTPGAQYFFSVMNQSRLNSFHTINFGVTYIPPATMHRITKARAKRLERAFHDAIEKELAPIWDKKP